MSDFKLHDHFHSGWRLNLYPQAGEASGSFYSANRKAPSNSFAPATDKTRAKEEAARRARGMIRRYCAHNSLNRFGTLTFRGEGCHDPRELRIYVGEFFKQLRQALPKDFPYLWVPEWHKEHGLHVHFAVGNYIKRSVIENAWPHGFIHIKLIGDLPHGSGVREESRIAARYLAKYVGKDFDDARNISGLHRYDIAQGFKPEPLKLFRPTAELVTDLAQELMGSEATYFWSSNGEENWEGVPAIYLSW